MAVLSQVRCPGDRPRRWPATKASPAAGGIVHRRRRQDRAGASSIPLIGRRPNTPSPPREMNTRWRPVASRASAAAPQARHRRVMATPDSSSASRRLGLRVWSLPSTRLQLLRLGRWRPGRQRSGSVTCSARNAMDSCGDVGVHHHQLCAVEQGEILPPDRQG